MSWQACGSSPQATPQGCVSLSCGREISLGKRRGRWVRPGHLSWVGARRESLEASERKPLFLYTQKILLIANMWVFLPHQISDTSWVSYDSVQFWYHLPGVSVRCYKIGRHSYKTAPLLRCQSQVPCCISDQLAINWGSHEHFLYSGLKIFLEWLTEHRETFAYI